MPITQQLKDAWLAELRDPNNDKIKESYFGKIFQHDKNTLTKANCMCAMGCLIKAHAKISTPDEFVGTAIVHCIDEHDSVWDIQFNTIVKMNDAEDKPLAEIADWVEKNIEVTP